MQICVYCSSSDVIEPSYREIAAELGREIARHGHSLVYGGCSIGLMGATARAVHQHGGKVVGVIPEFMRARGLSYEPADELLVTPDMRARKAAMEARADAFLALPGGLGTLEEMFEIITLKQLSRHAKPIVFLNIQGFYDPLITLFEHVIEHRFAKTSLRQLFELLPDVASCFAYLESYVPPVPASKWFGARSEG